MRLRTEHQRAWAANNLARKRAGLATEPHKPEIATAYRAQRRQPTGEHFVRYVRGHHSPAKATPAPEQPNIENEQAIERMSNPKRKRNPLPR